MQYTSCTLALGEESPLLSEVSSWDSMNALVVDAFYGIILPMNSGNVLGAVVSSVSANLRSLLTGDPP